MSGTWETNGRPAAWRRVVAPAALVIVGLLAGIVAQPTTSAPTTLPVDVDPPPAPEPQEAQAPTATAPGRWAPVPAGPLSTRQLVASAWTGEELLVWGGRVALRGRWFADGAAYDPRSGRWRMLPPSPLRARAGAAGVWTGTEFIVWGGAGAAGASAGGGSTGDAGAETARTTQAFADGAAYNPRTDRWRMLPRSPLSPRRGTRAAWTGTEAVLWGGYDIGEGRHRTDGARYDPARDRWSAMPVGPLGDRRPSLVQIVALDGRVLVWASDYATARTAVYDPATDAWETIAAPPLRTGVVPAIATVAGGVMLWGGWRFSRSDDRPVAVRYTTATNRWITVALPPAAPTPEQRLVAAGATAFAWQAGGGVAYDGVRNRWHALPEGPDLHPNALHAWTGDRLLLWSPGGSPADENRAAAWIPDNPWRRLPEPPGSIDAGGTAVWSGWLEGDQQLLVWGGLDAGSHEVGAAYDPAIGLWEAMPPPPLSRRVDPAGAWLAPEMVVVGGRDLPDAPPLYDAAAFDARSRSWRRLPDAPLAVAGDAVAVDGQRLYAAGRHGGRVGVAGYDPQRDEWHDLPAPPIPDDVDRLHAVWTEFELWVWGTRPDGEGAGAAWSPRRGRWRPLPRLNGVTGRVAWAWATSRVFVLGADGTTASLGRGAVQWRRYARSPVRSATASAVWNGHVLLAFDPVAGTMAAIDPRASTWVAFAAPRLPRHRDGRLLWTGRSLYAFAGHAAAELAR